MELKELHQLFNEQIENGQNELYYMIESFPSEGFKIKIESHRINIKSLDSSLNLLRDYKLSKVGAFGVPFFTLA